MTLSKSDKMAWTAVIVAGLGYFVDAFDMWLYGNFRVASLKDLGLTDEQITNVGVTLLNWQQAGFLIGGFLWGILGDKKGRAQVMFGSIFIYSLATFLNAFVENTTQYAILRFVSGLGLAGEIGAGITLIAELLPRTQRGIGTTFVTVLGVSGSIAAAAAGKYLTWKISYITGGLMGFALLFLRLLVHESGLYTKLKEEQDVKKGSFGLIFCSWSRIVKYLSCIALGVPIYLCMGFFVTFSPEIALAIGINEKFSVPDIMIYASVCLTVGDLLAGVLSQVMKSRKKPIFIFLTISSLAAFAIALGLPKNIVQYKILISIMSLAVGYWACLITTSAEQFGTNIRATVATTVPNLIRATSILISLAFAGFKSEYGIAGTALIITTVVYVLCFIAIIKLKETFHDDLDYYETKN